MDIISHKCAKEQGLLRFFTGVPCKNGHIAERNVKNRGCLQCHSERSAAAQRVKYATDKTFREHRKQYQRVYRVERPEDYKQMLKRRNTPEFMEKQRERSRQWFIDNRDKSLEQSRKYHTDRYGIDVEYTRAFLNKCNEFRRKNRARYNGWHAERRALKIKAVPPWADRTAIRDIYHTARQITLSTGILHHVDHIIPLKNEKVCGLHCEANLQIIPATENLRKSNKFKDA